MPNNKTAEYRGTYIYGEIEWSSNMYKRDELKNEERSGNRRQRTGGQNHL